MNMTAYAGPAESNRRSLFSPPRFSMSSVWKAFGEAHKAIYLGSDGRLGSRLAWIPMLLLSTRGRRTGLVRTMPLAYLPDPRDPNTFVIVASNGGNEKPPAWWLNLQSSSVATVRVGRESFYVQAELAPKARRAALWSSLRRTIPPYRAYEKIDREIPIVLLRRLAAEEKIVRPMRDAKAASAAGDTRA